MVFNSTYLAWDARFGRPFLAALAELLRASADALGEAASMERSPHWRYPSIGL